MYNAGKAANDPIVAVMAGGLREAKVAAEQLENAGGTKPAGGQQGNNTNAAKEQAEVKGGNYSAYDNQSPKSGDDWHRFLNEKYGSANVTWDSVSVDDIIEMPSGITNFTHEQVADLANKSGWSVEPLGKGSLKVVPYEQGGGYSMRAANESFLYIQYHPGGGHHGAAPYFKVSSGQNGTQRFFL